jgi:hypothetical protein
MDGPEHAQTPPVLIKPELPPATTDSEREANWTRMEGYINQVGDRLGMGIDQGIKQTIIGLNVLGINTTASCEGHIDRAIAGPWIDVSAAETEEMKAMTKEADKLLAKAERREKEKASDVELDRLYGEYHRLSDKVREPHLREVAKAMRLLEEFYAERKVPFGVQLTISPLGFGGRLQAQATMLQDIEDEKTKQDKLTAFQAEMDAFSAFVRTKYFGKPK